MTAAQVLALLRRIVGDVDETLYPEDETLFLALSDARDHLELLNIAGMSSLVIDTSARTIIPDPTLEHGHMLALRAGTELLEQTYRERVSRGELGASWSSGLESESTITAAKVYRDAINNLKDALQNLIMLNKAASAGTRVQ